VTTFNGHVGIPICPSCLARLGEAQEGRDHGYVLSWFERRYPPPGGESSAARPATPRKAGTREPSRRRDPRATPASSRKRFSLKGEILAAVRREEAKARLEVACAFGALDAEARDRLTERPTVTGLEAQLGEAIGNGDRKAAEIAVSSWRRHWLATFEEAAS
jgi:hypothetical protein